MIYSFSIFTQKRGLDFTWIATFLGSSGLVGLFTALIIDLVNSIRKTTATQTTNVKAVKKTSGKNKAQVRRKAKAKKSFKATSSNDNSKYHTKKIDISNHKAIKARKSPKVKAK